MKLLRGALVVFGALAITALGIDAFDTLSGSRNTLLGQLVSTEIGACPAGMIEMPTGLSFSCADKYEASVAETCPISIPANAQETKLNITVAECLPESKPEALPWVHVTRDQAQTLCLRAGKRLPTNEEWQLMALGTPDTSADCNLDTKASAKTGSFASCQSAVGASDVVGNVWEWTNAEVIDGVFNGRQLPSSGYVQSADSAGLAIETTDSPNHDYGADYFWSGTEGVRAVMRGGFYGSEDDAGVYTAHTDVVVTMSGEAIGFRCIQ